MIVNDAQKEVLLHSASLVRAELQTMRESIDALKMFPCGACEFASILLGRFLLERFGYETVVLSSELYLDTKLHSHAWLLCSQWHVDITADQFGHSPVICSPSHFAQGLKSRIAIQANEFVDLVDNEPDLFHAWQTIGRLVC